MRHRKSTSDPNESQVVKSLWFFWTFPLALLVSLGLAAGLFFLMKNQADQQLKDKQAVWKKGKEQLDTEIKEDKNKINETQVTLDQTITQIKEHKDKQELTKTEIKDATELAEQTKGSRVPKGETEDVIRKGEAGDRAFDASALKTINEKNAADKKYEQAAEAEATKDFAKVIKEGKPLLVKGGELVDYLKNETAKKAEEIMASGVTHKDQGNLEKKLGSGKVEFEKINKKFGGTAEVLKKYLEIISDPDAALYYRLNIFNDKVWVEVEDKLKKEAKKKIVEKFRLEWDPFVQRAKEAGVIK